MAAYLVVDVLGVTDEAGLGEYGTTVPSLVERYGGATSPVAQPTSWRVSINLECWPCSSFPT